jgi:site-specific DNA-methyltransferase (adenine-specific)
MHLKTLKLADIRPYERNPRINQKAIEPVMKSIERDGYRARIIVDRDGVIIAGHTRYAAIKRLGWKEVEVWIADDMTPEQIADYRIRDNLTADFAEWDFSELEAEIEELDLDFDMSEFEGFEETVSEDGFGEAFSLASGEKEPFTQMTFTLANEQAELIKTALQTVKGEIVETFGNENSNGNALYEVVREWAALRK